MRPTLIVAVLSLFAASSSWAQQPVSKPDAKADPRAELAKKIPGTKVEDVRATPIPGIFELAHGADIAYVSSDGRYGISGELIDIAKGESLTEPRRREIRLELLSTVPENQMLVFAPKEAAKYTINVFTDVDCGYCRKLHGQIAEYNKLGIKVRYLFFPRSGPNTESWTQAENVWCSANRQEALTRAKKGEKISAPKCGKTPVARDYELARQMGAEGTPAIILASGEMLPGYVTPAALVQHLRTSTTASR